MRRTTKVIIAAVTAIASVATMAASCDNKGKTSSAPPTYHSIFDSPTPKAGKPVASADAVPQVPTAPVTGNGGGFDCQLDISPPTTGLTVGTSLVVGTAYTYCTVPPQPSTFQLQLMVQRYQPETGKWFSWPPTYTSTDIPPMLPGKQRHRDLQPCQAGIYRLLVIVQGTTGDKKPRPFGPVTRPGDTIHVTQADCDGKLVPRP